MLYEVITKITAEVLYVDRAVRRILHRIDVDQCACVFRHFGQLADRVDRPGGVGGVAKGHDLGFAFQCFLEFIQLQGVVFDIEIHPGKLAATVFGDQHPGRDVGIVVHARDHNSYNFV